jgi:hypothetical protein
MFTDPNQTLTAAHYHLRQPALQSTLKNKEGILC